MSRLQLSKEAKIEKRNLLEQAGVATYPYSYPKTHTIAQCRDSLDKSVNTAGRIMALREHGKVIFLDLQDQTAKIQVMVSSKAVGEETFKHFTLIDPGDFLGVTGNVMTSKTGEITIVANAYTFLGKSLRPLPSEWNVGEDKEVRFRSRYLDMLINPDTKRVLDARWTILREVRRYLQDEHNFIEVETPVLQPLYGGTNAKPFSTHMNALDTDFYLRLAPELYLKRLIVGGYERIFEIARNFRNEGIDQTHQPEFTMIEWYEAYADYTRIMEVTEGLIKHLVNKLYGGTTLKVGEHEVNVGGVWQKMTMVESLQKYAGIDFNSLNDDQIKQLLTDNKIELIGEYTRGKAQFQLFDRLIPSKLIDPTWIIDYPRDVSPLSKKHRDNELLAERFEGYIGGKELCDGWSEITDATDQRQIFENEQTRMRAGDTEAHPLDEDYLEAMEYGMPPLGGIGIGIDRLVMFLTNTWSIREVIAFPTLRPKNQ
ncbi:lysine--tRNA ligase [Microgenomates group bacterium RIFCSPLOWO2_01_FULL_47_10]|nr:MAG: lysine--tRNA ligase [Microgenomates group bacterium RIFCSPLOWO2_01_FULL_47_10]